MTIVSVGIDLAKNDFAVHGGYATGNPCWFAPACHAPSYWNSSQHCRRVLSACGIVMTCWLGLFSAARGQHQVVPAVDQKSVLLMSRAWCRTRITITPFSSTK